MAREAGLGGATLGSKGQRGAQTGRTWFSLAWRARHLRGPVGFGKEPVPTGPLSGEPCNPLRRDTAAVPARARWLLALRAPFFSPLEFKIVGLWVKVQGLSVYSNGGRGQLRVYERYALMLLLLLLF